VHSIANRLALLFLAITLVAIGVVYFYVVPPLESSLRAEKLRNLAEAARRYSPPIAAAINGPATGAELRAVVRHADETANARVTLLRVDRGTDGLQLSPVHDPSDAMGARLARSAIGLAAATNGELRTGTELQVGEAAIPLGCRPPVCARPVIGFVAIFSAPLTDVQSDVALIRRRIVAAAAIALLVALAAGFLVSRALSGRIRRLERAARRVAAGDFSAGFGPDRPDELGRLADALDDMQLLQDEDLDEETRERFLGQLREQVDRLVKLATGLLDLSKLEAGALELHAERTDVGLLVQEVSQEFAPALAAHGSTLEVRLPLGPVRVVCDPERVAQVLRILIDNALTHTPAGTGVIVTAGRHDGWVRLGVGDFGRGIHRTMLPRIFEPFITSDDAQGSGLGLAIAHELAERMSGSLQAESRPGETTFTLDIPG
jgi:signal transduction histidine kinase